MVIERVTDRSSVGFQNSERGVLVIGANWCPDCRGYDVILEAVERKAARGDTIIRFGRVLLDDRSPEMRIVKLADRYGYILDRQQTKGGEYFFGTQIPGTFFYRDGDLVDSLTGVLENRELRNAIKEHLGVEV